MKITEINISSIKPYPKNQKKHDKRQINQVANSIKRFGFVQPLVIDKNNEIVIGHARFEGAILLEMDKVPCIRTDNLTQKEINALAVIQRNLTQF